MCSFSSLPLEIIRKVVNFSDINTYFVLSSLDTKINTITREHLSDVKFFLFTFDKFAKILLLHDPR